MSFNSLLATGATAATPTAGTSIVSLTVPGANPQYCRVLVTTYQAGTVDANAANASLYVNGAKVGDLPSTAQPVTKVLRFAVPAGAAVAVKTGATNGGAGSVYVASLSVEILNNHTAG